MKISKAVVGSVVVCGMLPLFAADPLELPTYSRKVTVEFASAADAKAATGCITPLPDDARISFGTRWDDTDRNDIPKAEMLNKAGTKGSFYFEGGKRSEPAFARVGVPLRDLGHAVGNHTATHKFVLELSPNGFFREVMGMRIILEKAIDRTVNSYVGPFGWQRDYLDVDHAKEFARILVETGHYVTGDNCQDDLGIPHEVWYPAYRFYCNDEQPDEKLFRERSTNLLAQAMADAAAPRLTLGTHAWCGAAGNEIQRRLIVELCDGKPWVHQSDWEYGAYRYQAINGSVKKLSVKGKRAVFEVTCFDPAPLAHDGALSLKFEPTPVKVAKLEAGERGTWRLPHDKGRASVTAVGEAAADGTCAKFPGLRLKVVPNPARNTAKVVFENGGDNALENVYVVLYVPPVWTKMRQAFPVRKLGPGKSFAKVVKLGERARADYAEDTAMWAVSADFGETGKVSRLWAQCETPGEGIAAMDVPRDHSLSSAYLKEAQTSAALREMSVPGAELPPELGWHNAATNLVGAGWFVIGGTEMLPEELRGGKRPLNRYFVWDFTLKAAGTLPLKTSAAGGTFWLNGKAYDFKSGHNFKSYDLPVVAGRNRLVLSDLLYEPKRAMPEFLLPDFLNMVK